MHVVRGRVLEQECAGWDPDPLRGDLDPRASAGAIRAPVDGAAFDVVEAAHCEEVVLLVVVERRLVAQPLPDRIRIRVDVEVVRVVVQIVGHLDAPPEVAVTRRRYPRIEKVDRVATVRETRHLAEVVAPEGSDTATPGVGPGRHRDGGSGRRRASGSPTSR